VALRLKQSALIQLTGAGGLAGTLLANGDFYRLGAKRICAFYNPDPSNGLTVSFDLPIKINNSRLDGQVIPIEIPMTANMKLAIMHFPHRVAGFTFTSLDTPVDFTVSVSNSSARMDVLDIP